MFDNVLAEYRRKFGSAYWTTNNIQTFPDNYQGDISNSEYLRVSVLPSTGSVESFGDDLGVRTKQISGLVAIKIFVKAGEGQGRLMAIADLLDNLLQDKTLTNGTKLRMSYLSVEGIDSANSALYSASYFIPFSLYGE